MADEPSTTTPETGTDTADSSAPTTVVDSSAANQPDPAATGPETGTPSIDWQELFGETDPDAIKAKLGHARKWEQRAKDNKTAADDAGRKYQELLDVIASAAGLKPDKAEVDPAKLAEQIAAKDQELSSKDRELRQSQVRLAVFTAAGQHQADPAALLDSQRFLNSVADLDPTAEDFQNQVESAIKKAVKANPNLKGHSATQSAGRSGGEFSGAPGGNGPISVDQLKSMSPEAVEKAFAQGRLQHLL